MAICPTCNMNVDEKTTEHKSEYKGVTYYFCCPHCKARFDQNPTQYIK